MDEFDTPTVMDARVDKDPVAMSQLKILMDRLTAAPDATSHLLVRPATAWKRAAERRDEARSEDALTAIRNANKVYLDAMRDLRRDRRAFEKARDEVKWWNVFNGERRAARIVARDTAAVAREARNARREARRAYPLSLPQFAIRCHAAHAAPATLWASISDSAASGVALWLSATAIGLNYAVVKLGMRHVVADSATDVAVDGLVPSQEERDLLQRLDPAEWQRVAAPRGLGDVVAASATLTESGIQAKLTLNGTMDVPTLQRKIPQLRAALRLREGTRLELREGKTGGHARLTLRTRSTADLGDTLWHAGREGIGIDTVTGRIVDVPVTGVHSMTGGRTNMGKSAYSRVQIMRTCQTDLIASVVLDPKRAEAYTWRGKIRTAGEAADVDQRDRDIYDLLTELMAEFRHRQTRLEGLSWTATPEYPDLFISIDEGAAIVRLSNLEEVDETGKKYKPYEDALKIAETLYGEARVVGMWFNWISQYLAKGSSIPQLVKENVGAIVGLTTKGQEGDRMLFDETAGRTGWSPSEKCGGHPGRALVSYKDLPPNPVQIWHVTEEAIRSLPDAEPWRSRAPGYNGSRTTKADIEVRMKLEAAGDPWADVLDDSGATVPLMKKPRVSAEDRDDQICEELSVNPCQTISALAKAIGASKSVVKNRLEQMAADGIVVKDDDGCWHCVP